MITVSEMAQKKIGELLQEEKDAIGLRVYVKGGGCHGYQYGMSFETKTADDDTIVEAGGVKVIMDSQSAPFCPVRKWITWTACRDPASRSRTRKPRPRAAAAARSARNRRSAKFGTDVGAYDPYAPTLFLQSCRFPCTPFDSPNDSNLAPLIAITIPRGLRSATEPPSAGTTTRTGIITC